MRGGRDISGLISDGVGELEMNWGRDRSGLISDGVGEFQNKNRKESWKDERHSMGETTIWFNSGRSGRSWGT